MPRLRIRHVVLWFGMLCLVVFGLTQLAAVMPATQGKKGVVATDHKLASKVGVEILKKGGNAVDAVCAAAFSLSVVNPAGSGIGGGGFMLIKRAKEKDARVIDFRETAPAKAHRAMYLKKGLSKYASRAGGLAVGIPGEVRGCAEAVKRYGKLTLKQVLAPSIRLAKNGFPTDHHLHKGLKRYHKLLKRYPGLYKVFYPGGKPLALGQILKRPRLAKTFEAIAKDGPKAFYEGWIAKDIVETVKKTGGILTMADLKNYKIKERKPLSVTYRGHKVYTMPPPSSGGVAIIQALNILRHKKLRKMGHNSSGYLHFLSEALQHAFSDRARFLGDTDFVKVPIKRLTSQAYADTLYKRIKDHVSPSHTYGTQKKKPRAPNRDGGTSHLSVVDQFGNMVAMTSTINTGFGSKVFTPKSGIVLNNEMDDFSTKPGKPNAFGLLQSKFNEIAPGKRPLSSMSPTIVTKAGKGVLAVGGSGGPTIITGTLQVMLNVLDFGLELNDAVSRSRIHHQWFPGMLFVESDLPKDVMENLKKRKHKLRVFRVPFTAVQAVQAKKGTLYGASDPRKKGIPAGY